MSGKKAKNPDGSGFEGKRKAPLGQWAVWALWGAGSADVAAVEDEPVVGCGALFQGDVALEVLLHFKRGFAVGEAKAVGNPEYMGVNCYYGFVVNY